MRAILSLLCIVLVAVIQPPRAYAQTTPPPACGNNSKFGISAPPACCPKAGGDFFEPYTGNVQREIRDLEIWGAVGELPMVWNRYYTSRGNILWNFSFVYAMYDGPLNGGQPTLVIDYPEGGQNVFTRNPANPVEWLPPAGIDKRVFQYGNNFILQLANGFRYRFAKLSIVIGPNTYFYYQLVDIKDSKQNLYRLTYTVNRQLDSVIEPAGRFFKVAYAIIGGRRLVGQVSTHDGRSVQYSYDIYNDGVSKWIRFLGATYGDATQANYAYVQSSPGVSLRLGHAIDPRFMGPSVNIKFTYEWSIAGGYIKEEKNGVTGQVLSTLSATDTDRTVCYPNGKMEVFKLPPAMLGSRQGYIDGLGRTKKHGYDMAGQGFLAKDTDALNRVISYDARTIYGGLLTVTNADGTQEEWTRDSLDQVDTYTDEAGRVTTYTRDPRHRVTRIDYADASFETFTYNTLGQVLDHQHRNGGTEHFTYDSRGLKTSFTDALGNLTTYSYDGADRLDSVTDARGNITSYQYNERGLLLKMTNPDLSFQTYAYDAFGNRTSVTDELGNAWATTYDEFRRPMSKTDPLSRTILYAYDLPGGICGCAHEHKTPTSITLASGKLVKFEYDVEWQKTRETTGAGTADSASVQYQYDMIGNLVTVVDPKENEWKTEYDSRNRRTAAIDPLTFRTEWTYDSVGNVLTIKRPDNGTTVNVYDNMNRLTQSTDPKSQVSQYRYDSSGNVDSMIDPNGNLHTFRYDLLNRSTITNYPGGTDEQFTYDAVGNTATYTNRAGAICTYTYDNRNRETAADWSDATPDVSSAYDVVGRKLLMISTVCSLAYAYNIANELISETQDIVGSGGGAKVVSYSYNNDGLKDMMTYPGGTVLSYGYTSRNLLDSIADGSTPALVRYTYDLNSNTIKKVLKNGTVADFTYDDANRMGTADHSLGLSSFARYDYGYDNVDRRTFVKRDLSKGDVYDYDAVDQSTRVRYEVTNPESIPSSPLRTVLYDLDAAGNRNFVDDNSAITTYAVDSLNQYTSVGSNSLSYNANGDLISGTGWIYTYDALSRLIRAANGPDTVHFAYDARNRCVTRTINGTPTYFYFDQWSLIEERDALDLLLAYYVHGAVLDELISRTASGNSIYYHQDALTNVVRLTDVAGAVLEQYFYDIFGAPTIKDGSGTVLLASSAQGNRFMFTGREYMQETGLYDYRNRVYSPELGRFLQTDPISFDAGDYNLYRYVRNNPVNLRDPSGLKPTKAGGADQLATALPIMNTLCDCCVEPAKVQKCKDDAKKIVDALVNLWNTEFGRGPYSDDGDPVGRYFCWDWASGFKSVAEKVNSEVWSSAFRRFAKDASGGSVPVHYAARIFVKSPKKENCEVSVDDGFFEDGLVHQPPWPRRADYKEDHDNPVPRKHCKLPRAQRE